MELGPELFALLNAKQWVGNQIPVVYGAPGLTSDEIASIEAQLGFRMPEDFAYLFQNIQDPGRVFFPWSEFDRRRYDESIEWVLHGIEFDIERNNLWLERWGKKPDTLPAALEIARKDFAAWPKLFTDLRSSVPGCRTLSKRQSRLLDHANRYHLLRRRLAGLLASRVCRS
jgi:hypothetical protein